MATRPDDVRFQGKTGSSRPTTKMTVTGAGSRQPGGHSADDEASRIIGCSRGPLLAQFSQLELHRGC